MDGPTDDNTQRDRQTDRQTDEQADRLQPRRGTADLNDQHANVVLIELTL